MRDRLLVVLIRRGEGRNKESCKKIRAGRKPSSVPRSLGVVIIYLGPRLPEGSCDLPGSLGRAVLTPLRGTLPYVVLLQAGFSKHSRSPGSLVGSCPTVSPLPRYRGGLLFCGTVHGVAPCPVSGPPCPAELGLSSLRSRRAITSPALIMKEQQETASSQKRSPLHVCFFS